MFPVSCSSVWAVSLTFGDIWEAVQVVKVSLALSKILWCFKPSLALLSDALWAPRVVIATPSVNVLCSGPLDILLLWSSSCYWQILDGFIGVDTFIKLCAMIPIIIQFHETFPVVLVVFSCSFCSIFVTLLSVSTVFWSTDSYWWASHIQLVKLWRVIFNFC